MKTSLSFFAYSFSLAIVFAIGFQQSNLNAQAAGPEYDIFKKDVGEWDVEITTFMTCLLYTSPSPRDRTRSRMPSSA